MTEQEDVPKSPEVEIAEINSVKPHIEQRTVKILLVSAFAVIAVVVVLVGYILTRDVAIVPAPTQTFINDAKKNVLVVVDEDYYAGLSPYLSEFKNDIKSKFGEIRR